ncbi:MAG: cystathionine gamma-synthase family protein [Thermoprotei archaeon]|nr:MAG: cystathionine gamma-synthase family protein [Thermoprotei archaeon]
MASGIRFSTKLIHGHGFFDEATGAFIPPIYQTAIFEQPDRRTGETRLTDRGTELKYSREENPTVRALERTLAALEEADDALAFSSGMAAISTTYVALLKRGSRLVVPAQAYGTTIQLATELTKFGVKIAKVWPSTDSIIEAVRTGDVVLVETITNPTLRVIDVPAVAKRCREVGATLVVDNTFASPVIYRPLADGADLVIESLTKYIAGHNDVVGGCIAGPSESIAQLWEWRRRMGSIAHPFDAFLTLRGLKTLEVRFERQSRTALEIAEFLEDHPLVEEVMYPGLSSSPYKELADRMFIKKLYGGVVSFKVKGGRSKALRVLSRVHVIRPSPSLGGTESLLTYPVISAAKTIPEEDRKKLGITEGLLRLSVGLEDPEDLKEDLATALS